MPLFRRSLQFVYKYMQCVYSQAIFWDRVYHIPRWNRTHYVVEEGLEFLILLPTAPLLLLVLQIHTTCLALPNGRVHGWALFMIDKSSTNGTAHISSSPSPGHCIHLQPPPPPTPGHSIPLYLPLPQYTKSWTGSQIRFTNRNPKPLWGKVLRRANEPD